MVWPYRYHKGYKDIDISAELNSLHSLKALLRGFERQRLRPAVLSGVATAQHSGPGLVKKSELQTQCAGLRTSGAFGT